MNQIYNIYCDESCHLENDHQTIMVLGKEIAEKEYEAFKNANAAF